MSMKLSQTLAGNWVITLPNPEEEGWETQLAEFDMEPAPSGRARETMMKAAAAAAVTIAVQFGKFCTVTSHIPAEKTEMSRYVREALESQQGSAGDAQDEVLDEDWIRINYEDDSTLPHAYAYEGEAETFLAYCEDDERAESFACICVKNTGVSPRSAHSRIYYDLRSVDRDGDYREVHHRVSHWRPMVKGPKKQG